MKMKMTRIISAFSKPRNILFPPPLFPHYYFTTNNNNAPTTSSSSTSTLLAEFAHFCYHRDLPRALTTMDAMHKLGLSSDCITYSHLIKSCISLHAVQQGRLLHAHLFSLPSYRPQTFLLNSLLNMYVKFNLLQDALHLFDQMPHPNVISWTTLISAFANSQLPHKALHFLILMLRQGVRPNMFTYSCVLRASQDVSVLRQLHSCILKHGFEFDCFVRSALIDIYSKWGHSNDALSIFNEMVTKDLVVWNSIIGGCAQNSDSERAMSLFVSMKRAGFSAEQSTLTSVLRACTSLALLELGRQVHVHVVKFKTDLILNNALLDMYCKCGSLKDANSVFDGMVEMDVITWSTMIAGLAQNGHSAQALKLFEQMKVSATTCKPNNITLLGVLFACSHAGLLEDGWNYFKSMKTLYAIEPGREHYGCILDLLGRAGKFDEAMKLMREMEYEPDAVTWRTLLGACRVHKNVELAIHAAKEILKLDPEDAGTYILLSNIYASMQRWDEVAQVRNMMKIKGVRKTPGCSWIEIDREVHAFILGDNSHPQMGEICKALNEVITRLTGMGYKPDTNFVLQDVEGEQKEDSLRYHSEKVAIVYGMMRLPKEKTIRIRKNLRICGDCHVFAKLVSKLDGRRIVIRDPILYHHFSDGVCSCGDYW